MIVYSDQPEALRPALASDPRVAAEFRKTAAIHTRATTTALVILHHFRPDDPAAGQCALDRSAADKPPVADSRARRASRRACSGRRISR